MSSKTKAAPATPAKGRNSNNLKANAAVKVQQNKAKGTEKRVKKNVLGAALAACVAAATVDYNKALEAGNKATATVWGYVRDKIIIPHVSMDELNAAMEAASPALKELSEKGGEGGRKLVTNLRVYVSTYRGQVRAEEGGAKLTLSPDIAWTAYQKLVSEGRAAAGTAKAGQGRKPRAAKGATSQSEGQAAKNVVTAALAAAKSGESPKRAEAYANLSRVLTNVPDALLEACVFAAINAVNSTLEKAGHAPVVGVNTEAANTGKPAGKRKAQGLAA